MSTRLRVAAVTVVPVLLLGCDEILDEPQRQSPRAPLEAAIVPGANLVIEADLQAVRQAPIFALLAAMAADDENEDAEVSDDGSSEDPAGEAGAPPFDEKRFLEAAGLKPGDFISVVASGRIDPADLPSGGSEGDAEADAPEAEGSETPFDPGALFEAAQRAPVAVSFLLAQSFDLDRLERGLREASGEEAGQAFSRTEVAGTPALHATAEGEPGVWATVLGNTVFLAFNEASLAGALERAHSGALAETAPEVALARAALPETAQGSLVFLAPESLRGLIREQIAKAGEDPGAAVMLGFVRPFENLRSIGMGVEAGADLTVATTYDLGEEAVAAQAQAMFGGMLMPMAQAGLAEAAGRTPAEMADRIAITSMGSTLSLIYRMTAEDAAGFEATAKLKAEAEAEGEGEAELEAEAEAAEEGAGG